MTQENGYQSGNSSNGNEKYESDTQRIIHRHLQNKDDVITDDDIKNVRVGVDPSIPDEVTLLRFEEDEDLDESGKGPITPWNTIDGEENE